MKKDPLTSKIPQRSLRSWKVKRTKTEKRKDKKKKNRTAVQELCERDKKGVETELNWTYIYSWEYVYSTLCEFCITSLYSGKYQCEQREKFWSLQIRSVAQSCPTLCDPMNPSTPGLPVHHQLPEFTQTHVHRVSDAIQPSHPLSSPSPPAPNPSQYQSLFQWVNSSHQVAKVLEFQL